MILLDSLETFLIGKGFTDIFKYHGPKKDSNHILLNNANPSPRTPGRLKGFFNDIILIRVVEQGTIADLIPKKQSLIDTLIGHHLTTEIIYGALNNETDPFKINSQQVEWLGFFNFRGCLT